MKTIVSIVLAVILSTGAFAAVNNTGNNEKNSTSNKFIVELLDISSEYNRDENGKIEMSSVFIAKQNNSSVELFGSFWTEFDIDTKQASDAHEISKWNVTDIRLAEDLSSEDTEQIKKAIHQELEKHFDELPKHEIEAFLFSSGKTTMKDLNNKAPLIIFTNQASALVIIDGEPYYEELDKRYSKISNAGAFILKDSKKDNFYMYGGGLWFSSAEVLNGWQYLEKVPNRINRVVKKHERELYDSMQNEQERSVVVPAIIVSTTPAELISTNGTPKNKIIENTRLVFVDNTDAELFRDLNTNKYYTLFSGRWFVSNKLEGKWEYVAADALPADFAKIPENHEKSNVLVSVPGTKAAENAVRDALIPNVTKNDISASLNTKVDYNGEPDFMEIEGTELHYAVNTSSSVIQWNGNYYLVQDAVWYTATNPYGPWTIAINRPDGVEDIPANNPLFNVKYVYIYKHTEQEVYTGYTSGYTGSYVNGATVVYGTGFYYHGWYGSYYYHHPMTYGFGFYYHPFYGWGPVYSPWFRSSFYWHWRPWYGYRPPHYRPPHHRPPHHRPPGNRPPSNVRPTQPIERPGRPDARPTQPSTRPTQPSVRPSQPSTRPSQPSVRPSQPSFRPSQPAMSPSRPAARPSPGPSLRR